MLIALRNAIAEADGKSLDVDGLARQLDTDRDVVLAALRHGLERGWLTGMELGALPAGCGTSRCACALSSSRCRRCPLASGMGAPTDAQTGGW